MMQTGELAGALPGVVSLAKLLRVNSKTIVAAFQILEKEELVLNQGPRRRRLVNTEKILDNAIVERRKSFGVLLYEPADRNSTFIIELHNVLVNQGCNIIYSPKALTDLKMSVDAVAKLVEQANCDGWIVLAGSKDVLEWFVESKIPTIAVYGRRSSLKIAGVGPLKGTAYTEALEKLLSLGHRRIAMLCRKERRIPNPGSMERLFLESLERANIVTGSYNLPDWEETPEGFRNLLDSLCSVTPPTAVIISQVEFFIAVIQHLGERGLRVPEDISVFCSDFDSKLDWCSPAVACVRWDPDLVIRRVSRWVKNVSLGKEDFEQTDVTARFIMGGTIGPAPGSKNGN